MEKLYVTLFNTPRLYINDEEIIIRRRKSLALMAYLVMRPDAISREQLAELLWQDTDPKKSKSSLRTALHELTSSLALDWLTASSDYVSVNAEYIALDVTQFNQFIAQARRHRHTEQTLCTDCVAVLQQAEQLYKNGFMANFYLSDGSEFEHWQSMQAGILQREYEWVLSRLAHHYRYSAATDLSKAITYSLRWLETDPLHEPAHRLLMQLYAENGQRNKALLQYQTCVEVLNRELATPPEEETVQLYELIRDNQPIESPNLETDHIFYSELPPLPSLLVGRAQTTRDVKRRLGIEGQRRSTVVIQGLPGVGKSTLVAALAHDSALRQQFPDGILWTSLGAEPDISAKLRAWSQALGIQVDHQEGADSISARITTFIQNKRMLLIVDDVWQVAHSQFFRVNGPATSVLFTSRLNDVALALASSQLDLYTLGVLTDEDALQLLSKLTPRTIEEYPQESLELARSLEGLPLAIQVAGRLLHAEMQLGWGITDLLQELRDGSRLLDAPAPHDMLAKETNPTVAVLLNRSTNILSAETRERFALLGLMAPKPATFDLGVMQAVWDIDDPKQTTRELVNRGLLEPVGGGRFQMHALLVLHAKTLLGVA